MDDYESASDMIYIEIRELITDHDEFVLRIHDVLDCLTGIVKEEDIDNAVDILLDINEYLHSEFVSKIYVIEASGLYLTIDQ